MQDREEESSPNDALRYAAPSPQQPFDALRGVVNCNGTAARR